ncbi:LLM class flavin-dependent oxidoreductase [Actinomadura craniellae]|uniref:LLM class flavin-dependent oxidoreductase n=1 Tax=Actinomadura craniellae TaxID=2231787 RepID=A0A365HAC5_9ACTN|nr:LLM class flavin-dependent oxidoreductase [Actinomadura craniellae]
MDYGRSLRFGYLLTPLADASALELGEEADRLGLDLVGVRDHPYQRRYHDAFALMAVLLARTSRIRVFPDVACLPLRPPTVLAKTVASLAELSGDRIELALGAGAEWEAIEEYGGTRRTTAQGRAALGEAIEIARLIWSDLRVARFEGGHYRLSGARPVLPSLPGVWLGVTGPKSLELTGRAADGWVVTSAQVPPARLPESQQIIDAAARAAERDPAAIRRVYNVIGSIDEAARRGPFSGPVEQWVEDLAGLATTCGIDTFIFAGPAEQLPTFALEVVPAVRSLVVRLRGRTG